MLIETKLFYIIIPTFLQLGNSIGLLSHYSFESPPVSLNSYILKEATGWDGDDFKLLHTGTGIGFGQFVDLQRDSGHNGYVEQSIGLTVSSRCILTFYQKAYDTNFSGYGVAIYWNNIKVATRNPTVVAVTQETVILCGRVGSNTLRF